MIDYESLSLEEQTMYDEARMTHGQRYQAAQDRTFLQHKLLIGFFTLVMIVYLIEPLFT